MLLCCILTINSQWHTKSTSLLENSTIDFGFLEANFIFLDRLVDSAWHCLLNQDFIWDLAWNLMLTACVPWEIRNGTEGRYHIKHRPGDDHTVVNIQKED